MQIFLTYLHTKRAALLVALVLELVHEVAHALWRRIAKTSCDKVSASWTSRHIETDRDREYTLASRTVSRCRCTVLAGSEAARQWVYVKQEDWVADISQETA